MTRSKLRVTRFTMRSAAIAAAVVAIAILAGATVSNARQGKAVVRGNVPGEWRVWGADAWSTRYSPLDQINAGNFNSLQVAWQWDAAKDGSDEYYRTTPLFANGRILTVATTHRYAYAINPADGSTLWSYKLDEGIRWQKAPRQFAGRGLAYWTDGSAERAVIITPGYHLVSLDAKTGKPDPKFGKDGVVDLMEGLGYPLVPLAVDDTLPLEISEAFPARQAKPGETWNATTHTGADGTVGISPSHGQIANSSPAIIVGNTIIVGNSAIHGYFVLHNHNISGNIRGYDVHTGKLVWTFHLLPRPGEYGSDTWKNGSNIDDPGTGKVDPWATYSADPELGLVYIPVGEGIMDDFGGHRPGANLFATSVVALDVKTGKRKWHYQMVHHDIWDYDIPMAPNLLDVTIDGKPRKIIAASTKIGWLYVLDRVTGEPIWPIPETPVAESEVPGEQAWPTQPVPSRPERYSQMDLLPSDLIDYTPAIKDSALKLAQKCRMGPYFVPSSPADGKGPNGPAKYNCTWYAPGASGGVNIDGGTAADPETGMVYVGAQTGVQATAVQHDPCSEIPYGQPHNSCGKPGAAPAPAGYEAPSGGGGGGGFGAGRPQVPTSIGGVSIFKPQQLGGITAYDLNTGDKKWWQPNGAIWRDPPQTSDPLFAGVTLPKIPNNTSQPQVIVTKTLLINGTGRGGGGGGGGARGGAAGAAGARAGGAVAAAPDSAAGGRAGRGGRGGGGGGGRGVIAPPPSQLYAFDKATGKLVGSVQIPGATSAVPMTFMFQGKQYIVFATGAGEGTKLVALTLPNK
jgi:quinoprotein glucose dehydrogenase